MKTKKLIQSVISLAILIVITGCQPAPPKITGKVALRPVENVSVGHSIEDRSIPCFDFGDGSDVILIIATIHGNENAGTPLSFRLMEHLRANLGILDGRRIVIMPIANPDGLAANTRFNSRGVDLNRNFEAANRENNKVNGPKGLSELESIFIKDIIQEHQPNRILSLHESLNCIDYDGPGDDLANHLGKYCDLPVKKLGSRPGSLGSYAGNTLGIPIITLELTEADENADASTLWRRYGKMLLAGITYPNVPE